MKRNLRRVKGGICHYNDAGERVEVGPDTARVSLSLVRGDISCVYGNISGVYGNLSGISGDLTGVNGDLSGVYGDIDDCELSPEDRARGVHIDELIGC